MHKGHISGRGKNVNKKRNKKWRFGINFEKIAFETQKSVFPISYFEKWFYMQFLPTANFALVWPNYCTTYWVACPKFWHPSDILILIFTRENNVMYQKTRLELLSTPMRFVFRSMENCVNRKKNTVLFEGFPIFSVFYRFFADCLLNFY